MPSIKIQISGVSAEIVLGNYIPTDQTIVKNWEEFYHYNDLIHQSQLLTDHLSFVEIFIDDISVFKGKIPNSNIIYQKSFSPALFNQSLYLRTECVEQSIFQCVFETANFDKSKLLFETQSYDMLFKVGSTFIAKMLYDGKELDLVWLSGKPIGNICVLCNCENGYLVPFYDAINKIKS
jgi:hypothetical protein